MPRRPNTGSRSARKERQPAESRQAELLRQDSPLRIIGGKLRGRRLLYSGQDRTRPMKERLREAVFNLVSSDASGKHAIDLFAGTGALGLEAISRGAARATFVEQHFPTAAVIRQNIAALGVEGSCQVVPANTFIWAKTRPELGADPWLVFCSPPYAYYRERSGEMLGLIEELLAPSPTGSLFVVEADRQFDFALLPRASDWDVRAYGPAVVGVLRTRDER